MQGISKPIARVSKFILFSTSWLVDVHLVSFSTGLQLIECPDTVRVDGSLGSPTREAPCPYRTHDRSLLGKHRKKVHNYIPNSRNPRQGSSTLRFVPYPPLPSTAPGRTTAPYAEEPRQERKQIHQARGSRETQASNATSSDAAGPSSSGSSKITILNPYRGISPNAHGQLTYGELRNADVHSGNVPVANQDIPPNPLGHTGLSNVAGWKYNNNVLVTNQGFSSNVHRQSTHTGFSNVPGYNNVSTVRNHQGISLNAHGRLAHIQASNFTGYTIPLAPYSGAYGRSSYVSSLHAASHMPRISSASSLAGALGPNVYTGSPAMVTYKNTVRASTAHAPLDAQGSTSTSQNAASSTPTSPSCATSVAPNTDIPADAPSDLVTNANSSTPLSQAEGSPTAPTMTEAYDSSPSPRADDALTTDSAQTNDEVSDPEGLQQFFDMALQDKIWAEKFDELFNFFPTSCDDVV